MSNVTPSNPRRGGSARPVRLRLAHIDVWSATKVSFFISLCAAIIGFVTLLIVFGVLSKTEIFAKADELFRQIVGGEAKLSDFFGFTQVFAFGLITAVLDIIVGTALGAVFAIIYNMIGKITGGLQYGFTNK